jgi:hypothetical protein
MSSAEFRKENLHNLKLQKEETHRKQIQIKQGNSSVSKWDFNTIVVTQTLAG